MASISKHLRLLASTLIVLLLASACSSVGGASSRGSGSERPPTPEPTSWLGELASAKRCGTYGGVGAVVAGDEPVLIFGRSWDETHDDEIGYVQYGTAEFDALVFDGEGDPLATHVFCTSCCEWTGSYEECPDGSALMTQSLKGKMYVIDGSPDDYDWSRVAGSVTCQQPTTDLRNNLDGVAWATSYDLDRLFCEMLACILGADSLGDGLAGALGDERASACPFMATTIVSGVRDVSGVPTFVVVGANEISLLDVDPMDDATDVDTEAVFCVFVEDARYTHAPCGEYVGSDVYDVKVAGITTSTTWVSDPADPDAIRFGTEFVDFSPCPETLEFTDPRGNSSLLREHTPFSPTAPSVLDESRLGELAEQAQRWGDVWSAPDLIPGLCSALDQVSVIEDLHEQLDLSEIHRGREAPASNAAVGLVEQLGEAADQAMAAVEGTDAKSSLGIIDMLASVQTVVADWMVLVTPELEALGSSSDRLGYVLTESNTFVELAERIRLMAELRDAHCSA